MALEEGIERLDILPVERQPAAPARDDRLEPAIADEPADRVPEVIACGGADGAGESRLRAYPDVCGQAV